jgi:hypothetical protein
VLPETAYDDELSAEELKLLNEGMSDDGMPPPDESEGAPQDVDTGTPAPEATPTPQVVETPQAEAHGNDDGGLADFQNKHAGKTPEELLKIAFQQTQRAGKAEVVQRQTQEQIDTFRQKAADVLKARKESIAQRRETFKQQLEEDPDAATQSVHEMLLNREEQEAEHEEHTARIDAAIELAQTAIPNFANRYQDIRNFGQELNYSPQEIDSIDDGRNIVTLYLASLAGNLIKSGVMDAAGNFRSMPSPTAETDPRLKMPANAMTSLSTPGSAAAPAGDDGAVLANMLQMSDADFSNLSDEELDLILRRAS